MVLLSLSSTPHAAEHPATIEGHSSLDAPANSNRYLEAIQALHTGRCEDALATLGIASLDQSSTESYLLRAFLHAQDLCLTKAPREAVRLLQAGIASGSHLPQSFALLGGLYWRGDGIKQDKARARSLFRLAALNLGPALFVPVGDTLLDDKESASFRYWGLTERELKESSPWRQSVPGNCPISCWTNWHG